ncbi:hypothetical protein [Cupriavidus gilardii]|uniref:hypothetical protein n=1 Tax=Cupriavidus gilardii TaxID=82541 RepID=UPI0021B182F3|nr:hypothetical protein [Cupriavidus gilardii]UXC34774.1 hypothetical protein N4G38_10005 [Cupriavidus gilardii]UXC37358.1 hypothetical protein N4G38_07950 [Cupriavidus gilardii]
MNVNAYLAKRYGPQPCWELVADVFACERSPIRVAYQPTQRSVREMADAFRLALHRSDHGFVKTDSPVDFSVVLMGRNAHVGIHHCGVWYGGKILHAEPNIIFYEELSAVRARYQLMEYWTHAD